MSEALARRLGRVEAALARLGPEAEDAARELKKVTAAIELHPAQAEVARTRSRFKVLMCGRRFGKTRFGESRAVLAMAAGFPVGWFAPTHKVLADAWRDLKQILGPVIIEKSETERRLVIQGGGSLEAWSLEVEDAGRSRRYALAVVDEAGLVRDLETAWTASIRPTLTDLKGGALFLGTPKGRRYFWRLFQRGRDAEPGWRSWQLASKLNPFLDPGEIEEARRDMPERVFAQEYEAVPSDDVGNPFGLAAIRASVAPLSAREPVVWGWDLAKSVDWTVGIALDAAGHVCRFERFQLPWGETKQRILAATGGVKGIVDSTGVGDPITEDLQRHGTFVGHSFTSRSKQQLMEGLAAAIQSGRIHFPDGVIAHELEAFEYVYRATGVSYSAPSGLHDDCVCALALAWSGTAKAAGATWEPYLSLPDPAEIEALVAQMRRMEREAAEVLRQEVEAQRGPWLFR